MFIHKILLFFDSKSNFDVYEWAMMTRDDYFNDLLQGDF